MNSSKANNKSRKYEKTTENSKTNLKVEKTFDSNENSPFSKSKNPKNSSSKKAKININDLPDLNSSNQKINDFENTAEIKNNIYKEDHRKIVVETEKEINLKVSENEHLHITNNNKEINGNEKEENFDIQNQNTIESFENSISMELNKSHDIVKTTQDEKGSNSIIKNNANENGNLLFSIINYIYY